MENSTQRPLKIEEFRGFTLLSDQFALIYVNTRDSKTAQLFSLAHELGHIALAKPGVSDHSDKLEIERWCNKFAAAFLAPKEWVISKYNRLERSITNVEELATQAGISREAMLWRLVSLGYILPQEAQQLLKTLRMDLGATREETKGGAIPRAVLVRSRVGSRFFEVVSHAAETGGISKKEAARYLGAASYDSFEKLVASRKAVS